LLLTFIGKLMAVPVFQEITLPLLRLSADGQVRSLSTAREELAKHFSLTEAEQAELLPSGRQGRFANRVAWAKVYLERAGVLNSPNRGQFQITDRGRDILASPPDLLDIKYLARYPEFQKFRSKSQEVSNEVPGILETCTPEETLDAAYQSIRNGLASELLDLVKAASPLFFEQLVVELLLKMGYGRAGGNGEVIGRSGDEGIDGVIAEDRLGLEMVYLQAKRWTGTVGRPEIQKFVGALHGKRARKGVFITTGTFSGEAQGYVQTIDPKVALIDGTQLVDLMIDYNLGVAPSRAYEIKRIDSDFFDV
jgi:restriction system protein